MSRTIEMQHLEVDGLFQSKKTTWDIEDIPINLSFRLPKFNMDTQNNIISSPHKNLLTSWRKHLHSSTVHDSNPKWREHRHIHGWQTETCLDGLSRYSTVKHRIIFEAGVKPFPDAPCGEYLPTFGSNSDLVEEIEEYHEDHRKSWESFYPL